MNTNQAPPDPYIYNQKFPHATDAGPSPDSLIKLQSQEQSPTCNITCGPYTLKGDGSTVVKFGIVPSPLHSYFYLELQLYPRAKDATRDEIRRNADDRMWAVFCTSDPTGKHANRVPNPSTENANIQGPFNYSDQLYDVRFRHVTEDDRKNYPLFSSDDVKIENQLKFSWRSISCFRLCFGRNIREEAKESAYIFMNIIKLMLNIDPNTSNPKVFNPENKHLKNPAVHIITKYCPMMEKVFYPYFTMTPNPVPTSYWPCLKKEDPSKQSSIMEVRSNGDFELVKDYVSRAFAEREKKWFKPGPDQQSATTIPPFDKLKITKLPKKIRFLGEREYIAHILGAYQYEDQHSKTNLYKWFNGMHLCDIIPDSNTNSSRYMILLDIRPPPNTTDSATNHGAVIPEVNDRVDINLSIGQVTKSWTGRVVRISSEYLNHDGNMAIIVVPPPTESGGAVKAGKYKAQFRVGHQDSSTDPTRDAILNIMTSANLSPWHTFIKTLVLANNSYTATDNIYNSSKMLPQDWESKMRRACESHKLNPDQTAAVKSYFTHRVTLCRGSAGTGKDTLIDTILDLEEQFKKRIWACTHSNAALDILVGKLCKRKGNELPETFLRIRPEFQEAFTRDSHDTKTSPMMSLHKVINSRLNQLGLRNIRPNQQAWTKEIEDLEKLEETHKNMNDIRPGNPSIKGFQAEEDRLEQEFHRRLRAVQQGYAKAAQGIFSTSAAASGPLLAGIQPNGIIVNEASQMMEACALMPILHGVAGGKLSRVLLIGDDQRPTLAAPRNPFALTGEISLLERLVTSGFPVVELNQQFRG